MPATTIRVGTLVHAEVCDNGYILIKTANGTKLGELLTDVDGYVYYWPSDRQGCWAAHVLKEISLLLDHLNEPWHKHVTSHLYP